MPSSNSLNKFHKKSGDLIWYITKENEKIINLVINENLNLNNKLSYVIFQKITELIKELENSHPYPSNYMDKIDSKGRKFISFKDPDFQGYKELYYEGKILFSGLIYSIESDFPGFENKVYVGLTIKDIEKRFEEHVLNSMRGFLITNGDIELPGYGKLQDAIINSLIHKYNVEKSYNQIKMYSNTYQFKKRRAILSEIIEYLKKFCFKIKILEFHYSINSLDEREKFYIENYPQGGKTVNTVKNGYNMNVGSGGPGKFLPIYDIAILIALGQSIKNILLILNRNYNLGKITRNILVARIDIFFSGWYQAQEMFLKPIIESLVNDGFNRNEIYLYFKDLEVGYGWFRDWSVGEVLLEFDIQSFQESLNIEAKLNSYLLEEYNALIERFYCGIPERKWLNYIMKGIPIRSWRPGQISVCSLTKIGERKINTILNILFKKFKVSNKYELRYFLQKTKSIEILKRGYIQLPDKEQSSKTIKFRLKKENFYFTLCKDVFKLSIGKFSKINECKKYFEKKLFKGKSVEDVFKEYYLKI